MRIAVDARMIVHSGIGTYLRNVLRRLIESKPLWQFELLGDEAQIALHLPTERAGIHVHHFTAPIYSISEQINGLLTSRPADLLWVPHYNIPVMWRGKLVATVHDLAHLRLPEVAASIPKKLYATAMMRAVRLRANGLIFVSEFTAREFRELVGTPKAPYRIIGEGVDEEWFATSAKSLPNERPHVIFVGNAKSNKNLPRLLKAFSRIQERVPHRLIIVGQRDGFLTSDSTIEPLTASLGARAEFVGRIDAGHLRQLVASADLLVMPSTYEGFGLPILEAMACGCPVLSSTAASLPEVAGDAAVYCDPISEEDIAEKIISILSDSALRKRLIDDGYRRAAAFNWDDVAKKTANFLEEVAATEKGF